MICLAENNDVLEGCFVTGPELIRVVEENAGANDDNNDGDDDDDDD